MILILTEKEALEPDKVIKEALWHSAFVIVQQKNGLAKIYKSRSERISPTRTICFAGDAFEDILQINKDWYE